MAASGRVQAWLWVGGDGKKGVEGAPYAADDIGTAQRPDGARRDRVSQDDKSPTTARAVLALGHGRMCRKHSVRETTAQDQGEPRGGEQMREPVSRLTILSSLGAGWSLNSQDY